ncbi:hypothetical protein ABZ934_01575 [Streptomyces sp. NPDC046557]|uniref:hypothetical protein n=1 Tax=Streptomyces sp. NPDC046557 TaxID=3155372 RepID=UPI003403144C
MRTPLWPAAAAVAGLIATLVVSVPGPVAAAPAAGPLTETATALGRARTPTTSTKTFTAGADAWTGVRKVTGEDSHDEADLVLDDLAVDDLGTGGGGELLVARSAMSVKAVDSQETAGENGSAGNVLDGSGATIWHTQWYAATAPMPHDLSADGVDRGPAAASGRFADSALQQDVAFSPRAARYVRLKATSEVNGNPWTSMAELNVGYLP